MEIKTTVKFHHEPIRMAIIKQCMKPNGGEGVEQLEFSFIPCGKVIWLNHSEKNFLVISEKMKRMTQMFHSQIYTQKKLKRMSTKRLVYKSL